MPLENETDMGTWLIPLPKGIEEGKLTTARATLEKSFEMAISNCDKLEKAEKLQKLRDEFLKYNLFAFKGDKKYLIYCDEDITNEKFNIPYGDKRFLKVMDSIYKGEHNGFHAVFLKMPNPDEAHMKPETRKDHSLFGDVLKYIKSAALNTEKIVETKKMADFYKEEAENARKETSELRSKVERMGRALAMKPLSTGEEAKVKGTLRSQLAEFFYSGWRIVFAGGGGLIVYVLWKRINMTIDPMYATLLVAIIIFFVYPYIAERFK